MVVRKNSVQRSFFSANLINYRKAKGLTQIKLAELTGISKRMIAYYETNISNPPINAVVKISKVLNISLNELLGENVKYNLDFLKDIDMRTFKKIMLIGKLPKKDRVTIYNMIDAMIAKNTTKAS